MVAIEIGEPIPAGEFTMTTKDRTLKTRMNKASQIEAAFTGYDGIFPLLKKRADAAGSDRDRDALFHVHALLRAALRDAEEDVEARLAEIEAAPV